MTKKNSISSVFFEYLYLFQENTIIQVLFTLRVSLLESSYHATWDKQKRNEKSKKQKNVSKNGWTWKESQWTMDNPPLPKKVQKYELIALAYLTNRSLLWKAVNEFLNLTTPIINFRSPGRVVPASNLFNL